jgi:hypothetical protein
MVPTSDHRQKKVETRKSCISDVSLLERLLIQKIELKVIKGKLIFSLNKFICESETHFSFFIVRESATKQTPTFR